VVVRVWRQRSRHGTDVVALAVYGVDLGQRIRGRLQREIKKRHLDYHFYIEIYISVEVQVLLVMAQNVVDSVLENLEYLKVFREWVGFGEIRKSNQKSYLCIRLIMTILESTRGSTFSVISSISCLMVIRWYSSGKT